MITQLTKEQEKNLVVHRDKWVEIGLNTDRVTFQVAQKIVNDLNKFVLKDKKKPVFLFNSLLECWAYICLRESNTMPKSFIEKPTDVLEKIKGVKLLDFAYPYLNGSFDVGHFSWIDFMQYIGVTGFSKTLPYYMSTAQVGLIFPLEDYIVVSQKPTLIKKNSNGLHCENGPALSYDDGGVSDIYALNGIVMPKDYVLIPEEKMDVMVVLNEKNTEIRRELLRKIGMERFLQIAPHTVIDTKGNYQLLSINLSDVVKEAKYLKMINPSIGVYHVEGVHPDCRTVDHAINWRAHQDINVPWSPQILT